MLKKAPPPPAGWVGVGWQRHCKVCRSLRELLGTQCTVVFVFGDRSQLVMEVDHSWEVKDF